ncbi:MAG: YggS family pyridoxal phosphate-dependent enzyme [Calothrix sp. SM1_5_4]|nr:YggS family pyridoxal phosphate-dependent enzyme [Calothrix sp. SM1_5_4]
MVGPSVGERLNRIRLRMAEACARSGRDPASVRILAVSKLQGLGKIREAYEAGQVDFAENYVQEAVDKLEQLYSLPVNWHFIGRIQSNKVKFLKDRFYAIHSIERLSVAEHLNRLTARPPQRVFLQFNVGAESSKAGADESELENLLGGVISSCPGLSVQGLMVMPPQHEDPELSRPYFIRAREVLRRLREGLGAGHARLHPLDQLSMGTSGDFEVAIEEGATWVRIGTDVFGPREERNE